MYNEKVLKVERANSAMAVQSLRERVSVPGPTPGIVVRDGVQPSARHTPLASFVGSDGNDTALLEELDEVAAAIDSDLICGCNKPAVAASDDADLTECIRGEACKVGGLFHLACCSRDVAETGICPFCEDSLATGANGVPAPTDGGPDIDLAGSLLSPATGEPPAADDADDVTPQPLSGMTQAQERDLLGRIQAVVRARAEWMETHRAFPKRHKSDATPCSSATMPPSMSAQPTSVPDLVGEVSSEVPSPSGEGTSQNDGARRTATSDTNARAPAMASLVLRQLADLPSRFTGYTARISDSRVNTLKDSVTVYSRSRLRVGEHLLAALNEYKDAGWAVIEKADDLAAPLDANGKRPLQRLRVFLQSPTMRAVLASYPALVDYMTCDATHTVGNVAVHVYALLGHNPESGGQAVPLAFFLTLSGGPEGEHTDGIEWFFRQCRAHGIPPGVINLFDKDVAWFTALARTQHFELDEQSAVHAAHVANMEAAATLASALEIDAARTLLASLDPPSIGAGATVSGLSPGSAVDESRGPVPFVGAATDSGATAAATAAGGSTGPCEPPALLYSDLLRMHPQLPVIPRPVPDSAMPHISQHFKPGAIQQFGAVLLGVCAQLASDLRSSDITRRSVRDEAYAAFQEAHRPLFKFASVLLLDTDLSAVAAAKTVGTFIRRFCTPVVGLCYFHAKQAMLRKVSTNESSIPLAPQPTSPLHFLP